MTISEKILAAHAGLSEVTPGQLIECKLDLVLANDVTAPIAIKEFRKVGVEKVFNPDRIVLVADHYVPNKDIQSAEQTKIMRDFAAEQGIKNYYEIGCESDFGIEHALLPEQGHVGPGDLIVGADSHTCTYGALGAFSTGMGSTDIAYAMATGKSWFKVPKTVKFRINGNLKTWVSGKDIILHIIGMIGVDGALYHAMEFVGTTIDHLDMDDRFTICNMVIEAGAKNGIIAVNRVTREYLKPFSNDHTEVYHNDPDAVYAKIIEVDASTIPSTVACPHLPSNTKPASELSNIEIDQVVIGSCTNGRITDMRQAAEILKGLKVAKGVRLIIIPATQRVWAQAMKEGLFDIFVDAGAAISTPTCGPCLGGHMGILAAGERAVATTNRNFVGRMGDPTSEVYLASPYVAAASAVAGKITDPRDLGGAL